MRDRLLTYAVAVSIGVHIVILGVVGRTSAARPIEVEDLKLVRVEVVDVPEHVNVSQNKPPPKPEPAPGEPAHVSVPPPERIPTAPPPRPRPRSDRSDKSDKSDNAPMPGPAVASNKLPGDPGGDLHLGSPSTGGDTNVGPGGRTPTGWVPGDPGGKGIGSGSGEGVGKPDPVPDAKPGPGLEPSPPPPPPPPPPDVDVRVCTDSNMLPGPNCEHTAVKSFRPGKEPGAKCTSCKPKHVSTLADRSEPEFVSGSKRPKYPSSARDAGVEGSVTVEYTINTEGNVAGVKVSKSSGNSDLDNAARQCVESRKYKPAVQGGIPRNYRKRETFHFALD